MENRNDKTTETSGSQAQENACAAEENEALYSPSQIIRLYADRLRSSAPVMNIKSVQGYYAYTSQTMKLYGGKVYARLIDIDTREDLTIIVPLHIVEGYADGTLVKVTGYPSLQIRGSSYIILFNVMKMTPLSIPPLTKMENSLFDCRRLKMQNGFHNVEDAITDRIKRRKKVRITIITPIQSVAKEDFIAGLGATRQSVTLTHETERFSDAARLSQLLREEDDRQADIIALLRGGGPGIAQLDDTKVAETLALLKTPWVYGVGHEEDRPFIRSIADKAVATPRGAGEYIREIIEQTKERYPDTPLVPKGVNLPAEYYHLKTKFRKTVIAVIVLAVLLTVITALSVVPKIIAAVTNTP